jgi:hypothetical protein
MNPLFIDFVGGLGKHTPDAPAAHADTVTYTKKRKLKFPTMSYLIFQRFIAFGQLTGSLQPACCPVFTTTGICTPGVVSRPVSQPPDLFCLLAGD